MIAGDGCLFVQTSLVAIMMKRMDERRRRRRRRRMVCGVERWVRAELPPPLSPQQSTSSQGRAEHKLQRQTRAGQMDNI